MYDITFYEALITGIFYVCVGIGLLFFLLWLQYSLREGQPDPLGNYTLKKYLVWLFEGLWSKNVWPVLRVIFKIAAVVAGIALIYLVWCAIAAGIDKLSIKDVLVIIAILLALIFLKNTRQQPY